MRQSRPSLTAIKIARGIVFVAEDPRVRELLPPGTVELNSKLLTEAQLIKPRMVALYRKPCSEASPTGSHAPRRRGR